MEGREGGCKGGEGEGGRGEGRVEGGRTMVGLREEGTKGGM